MYFLSADDTESESDLNYIMYCIHVLNRETNSIWSTLTADAFPLKMRYSAFSFVKCSSFKLIIKGNKEGHLQEKEPIVMKTLSNVAAAPFEQVITDSFRDTATLAKICSRP